MRSRFVRFAIGFATAVGLAALSAPPPTDAASPKSDCIKNSCKAQKATCAKNFGGQFNVAKADCTANSPDKATRKLCQKDAKTLFKANKVACGNKFKECKTCCGGTEIAGCVVQVCGDGNRVAGEACDGGAANSDTAPNACRTNCTAASCGDNVIDGGEACDNGAGNSNTAPNACRTDCILAACGDDVADTGEVCDGADDDGCAGKPCGDDCTCRVLCGNGAVDADEDCDGAADAACPGFCRSDCSCFIPSTLSFTTGAPGGACGRINTAVDGSGTDLAPYGGSGPMLECGALYIGGGASVQPPSPTPDGAETVFMVTDRSNPAALVLGVATAADTGTQRNCTAPGCFFGPPLPIPNPAAAAVSTCVINQIAATPAAGGTLDAITGNSTVTLPLTVTVYVTGDLDTTRPGIQPCAQCVAGRCTLGTNAGGACTTPTSLGSSHDCPPPPEKTPLAPFGVDLSPLATSSVIRTAADGNFCGATTGQRNVGAFGQATAHFITEMGSPAGDLRDGALHHAVQSSIFCIPNSGDPLVDAVADLPGTGAITLSGETRLVP
jgi:hypothetical protein